MKKTVNLLKQLNQKKFIEDPNNKWFHFTLKTSIVKRKKLSTFKEIKKEKAKAFKRENQTKLDKEIKILQWNPSTFHHEIHINNPIKNFPFTKIMLKLFTYVSNIQKILTKN